MPLRAQSEQGSQCSKLPMNELEIWSCCQDSKHEVSDEFAASSPCPHEDKRLPLALLPQLKRCMAKGFQQ